MRALTRRLSLRLAAAYFVAALALVLTLGVTVSYLSHYYLYANLSDELDGQTSFYATFVAALAPDEGTYRSLVPSLAGRLDLPANTAVRFFNPAGQLLGASRDLGQSPSLATVAQVRSVFLVPVPKDQPARFYRARPIVANGQIIGIVETSRSTGDLNAFLTTLRTVTTFGGLGAAIVAGLLSTIIAAWISRPIRELEVMAGEIAGSNFGRRIAWNRQDELGRLATGLNQMSARLALTIDHLNAERTRLNAVLENLRDGIVAIDGEGQVMIHNTAARAYGFAKLDFTRLRDAISDGRNLFEEEWQEGDRTLALTAAPILEDDGRQSGILVVMRDITRSRQMEQMRHRFVSNISHELRTPLTSIKGFLSNLIDDAGPDQRSPLMVIDEETDRMTRLVTDLLELSRLQAGEMPMEQRPVALSGLAKKAAALLEARAQRLGVLVRLSLVGDLPSLFADPDRIQQVMVILLDNALKFTPAGGEIILETGYQVSPRGDEANPLPSPAAGGSVLFFAVADTGPGLSQAELEHAFDRLFSTKGAIRGKSAGLGLTIAREIVLAHGGEIDITNRPQGGARVTVTLPVVNKG